MGHYGIMGASLKLLFLVLDMTFSSQGLINWHIPLHSFPGVFSGSVHDPHFQLLGGGGVHGGDNPPH